MKILLDMDGVIADFVKAACAAHGRKYDEIYPPGRQSSWEMEPLLDLSTRDFWQPLRGRAFWAELPKMPEADALVYALNAMVGAENIFVCSTPNADPDCVAGKMDWLEQHFPQFRRRFIFTATKELCSHHNNVLIDDRGKNCRSFVQAGGRAFLVPRRWNERYADEARVVDLMCSYLESCLQEGLADA